MTVEFLQRPKLSNSLETKPEHTRSYPTILLLSFPSILTFQIRWKSAFLTLFTQNQSFYYEKCNFQIKIQKNSNLVGCDRALLICLIIRLNYSNYIIKQILQKKSCQIVAVSRSFSLNRRVFTDFFRQNFKSRGCVVVLKVGAARPRKSFWKETKRTLSYSSLL